MIARLNIGGPAYHVALLAGRLDTDRYRTMLATGALGPHEGSFERLAYRYGAQTLFVPHLRPDLAPTSDLRALAQLVRIVTAFRPHVVHTHTAKAGLIGRLATLIAPGVDPVILHTYHGHVLRGYFGRTMGAVMRSLERTLAKRTDCLVAVSQRTADELVELGIASREKFQVVPIGLDLDRFLSAERRNEALRWELLGHAEQLAVFVGRLVPIKRVDMLINAVALAREAGAPIRLAIVGDGECRAALEEIVASRQLRNAVTFLGFREDIADIMNVADIAVLSSDNEGTPVSLIEAAAAGLPAVATDVGGVSDIVTPDTGILVPAGDAMALARALQRLAADPDMRARLGTRAREHVRARYSSQRLLDDMDELYTQLLRSRLLGAERAVGERKGKIHI